MKRHGFTLIELLIVVAIIGILAAIAIPNFLLAQVRAKVARAEEDMASLGTGLETYIIDWNCYPLDSYVDPHGDVSNVNTARPIHYLSTPIAYVKSTTAFNDPFRVAAMPPPGQPGWNLDLFRRYEYWDYKGSYIDCNYVPTRGYFYMDGSTSPNFAGYGRWSLASFGPDKIYGPYEPIPGYYGLRILYDPSNGTTSQGEIIRCQKFAKMKTNRK